MINENIILVGMPGVGKTTVGKELARITGRRFVDLDAELVPIIGPVATYIETQGEAAFRKAESEIIARFSKERGIVIATGGGCVTIQANFAPLRRSGRIYHLTCPLTALDTTGRPLSQGGIERLRELERIRMPLYRAFAHCIIPHRRNEKESSDMILQEFYEFYKPVQAKSL